MAPTAARNRRSVRLKGFDYSSPGAYFVTIVTQDRAPLFGALANGEMRLSSAGALADACWQEIPEHFPNVELGSYVVMPNHVHGILVSHTANHDAGPTAAGTRRGTIYRAPTEGFAAPRVGSIPTIVRTYKAAVTRAVGRAAGSPRRLWQRNYYEHIIRDELEADRIRRYIEVNPMNWDEDEENPARRDA